MPRPPVAALLSPQSLPGCDGRWSPCAGWLAWLSVGVYLAVASSAWAGGGPENVVVVVNANSWTSQAVANHYVHLRQIPTGNVIYLDWTKSNEQVPVDVFREEILKPLIGTAIERGLGGQIDYVVYSTDFPYAIDCQADLGTQQLPRDLKPLASINGLTYLYERVLSKDPTYLLNLQSNQYMRRAVPAQKDSPTVGFRSWYGWGPEGELLETGGRHYILSMMLGYTAGRGNSLAEVEAYLTRSAAADGSFPKGTIYYTHTTDVRTTTRQPAFESAVKALRKLGVQAEIVTEKLPLKRADVVGLSLGAPEFDWPGSGSTILPGAICENLTSAGGVLVQHGVQTPLTELLRHGAAGSSGTVTEPLAIQDKFPFPFIHVHYARGCTLAEAFYQSVYGPFQLLIVGDPLCRPWANIPVVQVADLEEGATLRGIVEFHPTAKIGAGASVDRYELFVDGQRRAQCATGEALRLDTAVYGDGFHELRFVAFEASPIETQGNLIVPVTFANHGHSIELKLAAGPKFRADASLRFTAQAAGAQRISLIHNGRSLGTVSGAQGELEVPAKTLGLGKVQVQAIAVLGSATAELVHSRPVEAEIQPQEPLSGSPSPPAGRLRPGLRVEAAGRSPQVVRDTLKNRWLLEAGVQSGEAYRLSAWFEIALPDAYQFQVRHPGDLEILVDDRSLYHQGSTQGARFVPVSLAGGWHRLEVRGQPTEVPRLDLRFGGPGLRSLAADRFFSEP